MTSAEVFNFVDSEPANEAPASDRFDRRLCARAPDDPWQRRTSFDGRIRRGAYVGSGRNLSEFTQCRRRAGRRYSGRVRERLPGGRPLRHVCFVRAAAPGPAGGHSDRN